ncbi:MAG: hypothetical protein FJ045_04365 [Crenarchaeota archaeon]|nr:hypothetical protein [Thermoproteota archaeon]
MPRLSREAKQFAQRQRIKVFEGNELETFLASAISSISQRAQKDSFKFDTKAKFLGYLRSLGYRVEEKAKVQGRSGAKYTLDIVAYNDDGFISHTLGIGVIIAKGKVGLGAVSSFDTKAYDIGIHDKALLVSARLCHEARQFVQQQRIKVIEVDDPAKLM